jgi:hypothetical protein
MVTVMYELDEVRSRSGPPRPLTAPYVANLVVRDHRHAHFEQHFAMMRFEGRNLVTLVHARDHQREPGTKWRV